MTKTLMPEDINLIQDQFKEAMTWFDTDVPSDLSISKSLRHFDRTSIGIVKNFVESLEGNGLHSNRSDSRNVQLFASSPVACVFAAMNYNDELPFDKSIIVENLSNYYELHRVGKSEDVFAFGYFGVLPTMDYIQALTELICVLAENAKEIGSKGDISNIWHGGVNSSLFTNVLPDGKGIEFCVVMIPLHYLEVMDSRQLLRKDYVDHGIDFRSGIIDSYDQIGVYDRAAHQYSFKDLKPSESIEKEMNDWLLCLDDNDDDDNESVSHNANYN